MKLFIFVALAMMLVGMTAQAAEVPTSAGDKAMVFMFNGLSFISLDGYNGGLGLRYYIADGTAIRAGVEFGSSSFDDKDADMEGDGTSYGVTAIYEKHMGGACASVVPYWGLGVGYNSWSNKLTVDSDWVEQRESGFGVMGALGFEWGFTNCMTLGGEYELGFWKYTGESESDIGGSTNTYNEYEGSFMGVGTASRVGLPLGLFLGSGLQSLPAAVRHWAV
jgi:hypothetical protein